ncbi:hypothetical protein BJV77DRAFT_352755 [Russula vinacea]|nr:hypothetical protein BJV77DRAFT_352755 [Russula vinacea]
MPENIASTVMTGRIHQVEQEQHRLTSSREGKREGDTLDNGQRRSMPLGVPLTGNRLFTISWIVGLGIPKAVYSYRGLSLVSTTLDLVGGIILTLISYWLGKIKAERPELCPFFFKVDLRSYDGGCCGESIRGC